MRAFTSLHGLFPLLLVLSAACLARAETHAEGILLRRDDAPSYTDLLRRVFVSAIVIGDYVYLDGGEVSQLYNGKNGTQPSYPMNGTLSISLKTSWTNTSVVFKQIPKPAGAPVLNQQAIFLDPSGTGFYVWGGVTAYFAQPPPAEIWKFSADGEGGGSWAQEAPRAGGAVALSSLTRAAEVAYAQTRDVAYFLGGYASKNTDTSVTGDTILALPGLVAFNMTSGEITNSSSAGLNQYGNRVGGAAQLLPFGPAGVLLFLGGGHSPVATTAGGWNPGLDFNTLSLYDISTGKWLSQAATGSRPTPHDLFCSVGVQGPNKTYEIFMYGGGDTQAAVTTGDVYVLSLPGFVFFKAPATTAVRAAHACVVAGKRQMLSFGGTDGYMGFPNSLLNPDPWHNGMGVFDLTDMAWTGSYDPNAKDYDSPSVVKEWYAQGGLGSVAWTSDTVKGLFAEAAPPSSQPNSTNVSPGGSSPTGSSPADSSSKPPVGAIAGGVVGGVAIIAILLVGGFLWYRRRRSRVAVASGDGLPGELDVNKPENVANQGYKTPYSELQPQELDGYATQELPADHGFAEMESHSGAANGLPRTNDGVAWEGVR